MGFSDEELIGLLNIIQHEDGIKRERATREFLKFYYPIMKGYFRGCFSMINKQDVEDLSHSILERLIRGKTTINGNFMGYLYIAAKNTFTNYLKSNHKSLIFEEIPRSLQSPDSIYYPGVLVDYKIKEELFYEHHKKIRGKKVQERFQLWLNGASHKEIAQRDEICVGSSKSILFHIRKREGAIFFEKPRQNPY